MGADCCKSSPAYMEAFCAETKKPYAYLTYIVCGVLMLVCGIASLVTGCLLLELGTPSAGDAPWRGGNAIWCGCIVFVAGILVLCFGITALPMKARLGFFYASFGIVVSFGGVLGSSYGKIIDTYTKCSKDVPELACLPDEAKIANMGLLNVVTFGIALAMFIPIMTVYILIPCRAKKQMGSCDGKGAC